MAFVFAICAGLSVTTMQVAFIGRSSHPPEWQNAGNVRYRALGRSAAVGHAVIREPEERIRHVYLKKQQRANVTHVLERNTVFIDIRGPKIMLD